MLHRRATRQHDLSRHPVATRAGRLVVLALPVLALFAPAVFRGQVLFERDIHGIWLAQVEAFVRAVASGALPLWDPSVCFGQPLLGDPSAQVAYPWTWLNLVVPPRASYTLYVVSHLVLSGAGMYVLSRQLGLSTSPALAAAAFWELSGPLLSLVNVWHHFGGAAWLPWVLAGAHATFSSPGAGNAVRWGGAIAMQVLAGSADMCAMTALVAAADAARLRFRAERARLRAVVAYSAIAWALGLGISAVQWMPTVEVARRSARWGLPAPERTVWSLHPVAFGQAVVPIELHELPLDEDHRRRVVGVREPFLLSIYLGLPGLALVAASVGRPHAGFLALVATVAAVAALGGHTPLYDAMVTLVPPLTALRYPMKAMIVVAFAWSLLAAMGVGALGDDQVRRPLRLAPLWLGALAALAAALAAFLLWLHPALAAPFLDQASRVDPARALEASVRRLAVTASLAAVLFLVLAWGRRAAAMRAAAAAVAAAVLALDLALANRAVNPFGPPALFTFRPPAVEALRTTPGARVYVYEYLLLGGRGHLLVRHPDPRIAALLRADPFTTRRPRDESATKVTQALALQMYLLPPLAGRWGLSGAYDVDVRGLYPAPLAGLTAALRQAEGTPAHDRLLRLGGVTHVLALHDGGFETLERVALLPGLFVPELRVFRVPDPLPRVYAVPSARVLSDEEALDAMVGAGFDPFREVLVARPPAGGMAARPPRDGSPGSVRLVEARADRLLIEAELPAGGYVVVLDSHDPGWIARIDGLPADVLRANLAFRAVAVPAGRHVVEQVYRPRSVRLGGAVSAAALLATVAWAASSRRRT